MELTKRSIMDVMFLIVSHLNHLFSIFVDSLLMKVQEREQDGLIYISLSIRSITYKEIRDYLS